MIFQKFTPTPTPILYEKKKGVGTPSFPYSYFKISVVGYWVLNMHFDGKLFSYSFYKQSQNYLAVFLVIFIILIQVYMYVCIYICRYLYIYTFNSSTSPLGCISIQFHSTNIYQDKVETFHFIIVIIYLRIS